MDEKHEPAVSTDDKRDKRARALAKEISDGEEELAKEGLKEPYAVAGVAILGGNLILAIERIERLEGDVKLLTDLLASVEEKL